MKTIKQKFILFFVATTLLGFSTSLFAMGRVTASAGAVNAASITVKGSEDSFVYSGLLGEVAVEIDAKKGSRFGLLGVGYQLDNQYEDESDEEAEETLVMQGIGFRLAGAHPKFKFVDFNLDLWGGLGTLEQTASAGSVKKQKVGPLYGLKIGAALAPKLGPVLLLLKIEAFTFQWDQGEDENDPDAVFKEVSGYGISSILGVALSI